MIHTLSQVKSHGSPEKIRTSHDTFVFTCITFINWVFSLISKPKYKAVKKERTTSDVKFRCSTAYSKRNGADGINSLNRPTPQRMTAVYFQLSSDILHGNIRFTWLVNLFTVLSLSLNEFAYYDDGSTDRIAFPSTQNFPERCIIMHGILKIAHSLEVKLKVKRKIVMFCWGRHKVINSNVEKESLIVTLTPHL